jgi:hypothetical protein
MYVFGRETLERFAATTDDALCYTLHPFIIWLTFLPNDTVRHNLLMQVLYRVPRILKQLMRWRTKEVATQETAREIETLARVDDANPSGIMH